MLLIRRFCTCLVLIAASLLASCQHQGAAPAPAATPVFLTLAGDTAHQITAEIRGICEDAEHHLWLASNGQGVYRWDGKTLLHYTEKHGLSSDHVWLVEKDPQGNLWFKTYLLHTGKIAISRFDGHAFHTMPVDTTVQHQDVQGGFLFCEFYFDGKSLSRVSIPETSPRKNTDHTSFHYDIYDALTDRSGNTWLATCQAGLYRYTLLGDEWYATRELSAPIRDIFQDDKGVIWVGNNGGGLFRYDGRQFISFSKEHQVDNPDFETNLEGKSGQIARVWKITQDQQGHLWVATINNGIWRYDGRELQNFTTRDGLGSNSVWTIFFDHQNTLWAGMADGGVYVFDGSRFRRFAN